MLIHISKVKQPNSGSRLVSASSYDTTSTVNLNEPNQNIYLQLDILYINAVDSRN